MNQHPMTAWIRRFRPTAAALSVLFALTVSHGAVDFDPLIVSDLAGPGVGDSMAVGDFDRDCSLDLVTIRDESVASETLSVVVRVGDGEGSFPGGATIGGGLLLSDVEVADLDGDGIDDLITTESFEDQGVPTVLCLSTTPKVPVLVGDGLGSFTLAGCVAAKDHPSGVVAGDFDEDRVADLVVINATSSCCGATSPDVMFFHGNGDGTFLAGVPVLQRRGHEIEAADFDGDTHLDLAIAGGASTYVYLGNGDGSFETAGAAVTGASKKVAVGDLNNDGAPDIVAVGSERLSSTDDVVWVALNANDGSGSFDPALFYDVGSHPVDVAAGDLDLDGKDDVIVANNASSRISVLLATAGGALLPQQTHLAGDDPMALVVADLNKDGYPDIAVSNRNEVAGELGDGTVSVLLQSVTAPLGVGTASLADGLLGVPYHQCLGASGGTPPYNWFLANGALPLGLVLNEVQGKIDGIPTQTGPSAFSIRVEDSVPTSATRSLTIDVCQDADADGFSDCGGDCDDGDPARFPGNPEICDDKDNDCDDVIDSGMDSDTDSVDDLCDNCPVTPNGNQADADGDGTGDACDGCPGDPDKISPGLCGCGVVDVDSDDDGTPDCDDECPTDPNKVVAGDCGCGVADTDSDGDGVAGCIDCNDGNANCTTNCTDNDGDGYCVTTDCQDGLPDVNPGAEELGCDGLDNDCDAGTPDVFDGDGDTFDCSVDCNDANPSISPGATEAGCDGIDNDCNASTPDLVDADTDGRLCNSDCDDGNPAVWGTPGETTNLLFVADNSVMSWEAPFGMGGIATSIRYDTLRSGVASDFSESAICIESNDGPNRTSTDAQEPLAVGQVFYYLSRARNACPNGTGTVGTDWRGVERPATSCP